MRQATLEEKLEAEARDQRATVLIEQLFAEASALVTSINTITGTPVRTGREGELLALKQPAGIALQWLTQKLLLKASNHEDAGALLLALAEAQALLLILIREQYAEQVSGCAYYQECHETFHGMERSRAQKASLDFAINDPGLAGMKPEGKA